MNILTWTENLLCHIQLFHQLNYIHLLLINFFLTSPWKEQNGLNFYVGVIRTLNGKYQKFMTYRLVYNIDIFFNVIITYKNIGNKTRTCMGINPFRPKRNLSTNSSIPIFFFLILLFALLFYSSPKGSKDGKSDWCTSEESCGK